MNDINQLLSESLQKGFINHLLNSNEEYLPQLLYNDSKSQRKILTTIETELRNCDELLQASHVSSPRSLFLRLLCKGSRPAGNLPG